MKKIIIILMVLISLFLIKISNRDNVLIPNEAIRFRVLANSNSFIDQDIKKKVSVETQNYLYQVLNSDQSIDKNRKIIKENMNNIKNVIENVLTTNNFSSEFRVNYGYNYFPEKKYNGVTYKKGKYESLLITIGSGKGNNWWCVLFPPLCLLDAQENKEVEYKFFVTEILKKYFNR